MLDRGHLKALITHPIRYVRDGVMEYTAAGWIRDPEIVPQVLNACDQYGYMKCLIPLQEACGQPIDAEMFREILGRIKSCDDPELQYNLSELFLGASVDVMREVEEDLKAHAGLIDPENLEFIKRRLRYAEYTDKQLWDSLAKIVTGQQAKVDEAKDVDQREIDALIETLARQGQVTEENIRSILEQEDLFANKWAEVFMIDLAGERRLASVVPTLVRRFGRKKEGIYVKERVTEALVKIGDPEALRLVCKAFATAKWPYRESVVELLGQFKHPAAIEAASELLKLKGLPNQVRDLLVDVLVKQLAPEALEWLRQRLSHARGEELSEIHQDMLVVAEVNGIELPEKEAWLAELARRDEAFDAEVAALLNLAAQEGGLPDGVEVPPRDPWDEADDEDALDADEGGRPLYGAPGLVSTPGMPYRRPESKIGPNDPCPCGSGRKYKKCCGKRG